MKPPPDREWIEFEEFDVRSAVLTWLVAFVVIVAVAVAACAVVVL